MIAYIQGVIKKCDIKTYKNINENIYSYIKYRDCTEKTIDNKIEEIYKKVKDGKIEKEDFLFNIDISKIREYIRGDVDGSLFRETPENILIVNFNYTTLEDLYDIEIVNRPILEWIPVKLEVIHIHGRLNNDINEPIMFGYGDEMDDNYKTIENINDNEYLDNIKSFKYFETNNYKELLGFINKGEYQLFLFGHSCGVSDRVLLNTLFEHENCVSIKPFFHRYKGIDDNKKEFEKDDYSNIIRNISRHFNDKAVMRDKIVPKVYCEPLVE